MDETMAIIGENKWMWIPILLVTSSISFFTCGAVFYIDRKRSANAVSRTFLTTELSEPPKKKQQIRKRQTGLLKQPETADGRDESKEKSKSKPTGKKRSAVKSPRQSLSPANILPDSGSRQTRKQKRESRDSSLDTEDTASNPESSDDKWETEDTQSSPTAAHGDKKAAKAKPAKTKQGSKAKSRGSTAKKQNVKRESRGREAVASKSRSSKAPDNKRRSSKEAKRQTPIQKRSGDRKDRS